MQFSYNKFHTLNAATIMEQRDIYFYTILKWAQSAKAVEYTNCI